MAYVEGKNSPMPRLLEIGLLCEQYHTHPGMFGLDMANPRVTRDIDYALRIYKVSMDRHTDKKKSEWDKDNKKSAALLRMVRGGKSVDKLAPNEVIVNVPTREGSDW